MIQRAPQSKKRLTLWEWIRTKYVGVTNRSSWNRGKIAVNEAPINMTGRRQRMREQDGIMTGVYPGGDGPSRGSPPSMTTGGRTDE